MQRAKLEAEQKAVVDEAGKDIVEKAVGVLENSQS